jgi:catechol 2,3-dioxygenase-like lactoylglutathione lyase family enzyme
MSGFRTGPLGVGHAVLTVENIDAVMPFYVDVLGFGLSDYIEKPFRAYFFHINARHHSLALIETGRNGMHHLMVEMFSLDDVGQCYDIALVEPERVSVTLGRHTNDFMTSFYARTPSSFMVECGWGGRDIEPKTWQPFEMTAGPSLWGHERVWLPPADREVAREMRLHAAASGLRAPVQVIDGNYKLMSGTCPWWDGVSGKG